MDLYTVVIEAYDARAVSLPLGGSRYDFSLYQDLRGTWQRVSDPGRVAVLYGYLTVAVEGDDVREVCQRIGRETAIALDEPPPCARGGLYVALRTRWRVRSANINSDGLHVHASDRPRVCASHLQVGTFDPAPVVGTERGRDER